MTKTCSICKTEKDKSEFHSDKKRPDGLFGYCKSCRKIHDNRYYLSHPEKKKKNEIRTKGYRKLLNDYKHSHGCYFCDETESVALDFHHCFGEKEKEVAIAIRNGWKAAMREIEKCIVVCANCHRKLHAGLLRM